MRGNPQGIHRITVTGNIIIVIAVVVVVVVVVV